MARRVKTVSVARSFALLMTNSERHKGVCTLNRKPWPAFVELLVDQEMGKAPVNFVLRREAIRAEQILLAADGFVEGTLLLCRFGCFPLMQLELLDPALDGSQDGKQMKLLLD